MSALRRSTSRRRADAGLGWCKRTRRRPKTLCSQNTLQPSRTFRPQCGAGCEGSGRTRRTAGSERPDIWNTIPKAATSSQSACNMYTNNSSPLNFNHLAILSPLPPRFGNINRRRRQIDLSSPAMTENSGLAGALERWVLSFESCKTHCDVSCRAKKKPEKNRDSPATVLPVHCRCAPFAGAAHQLVAIRACCWLTSAVRIISLRPHRRTRLCAEAGCW